MGRLLFNEVSLEGSQFRNAIRTDFSYLELAPQTDSVITTVWVKVPRHALPGRERLIYHTHVRTLSNDQTLLDPVNGMMRLQDMWAHDLSRGAALRMTSNKN